MKTTLGTETATDAQLVEWSLTGDREAFGRIVERYQSLVCSITYGATGSLTLSEDIAQETFLTAWRQLTALNDATRLRAWLCGIARNLTNNFLRRGQREPAQTAEALDAIHELPGSEPSPSAQAVSREEEAILWRALERIPETYREPLILFYREQQSVERVAEELELSEDAVKQRLSRGRKLLADEVAAFVEGTLQRTAPGKAFTLDVLAALPLAAASMGAAGVGAATKGTAATKSAGLLAWLAPFVGIFGGLATAWLSVRLAPTEAERRVKKAWFIALWVFVFGWCFLAQPLVKALGKSYHWTAGTKYGVMTGFWWFYGAMAAPIMIVASRRIIAIRQQFEAAGGVRQPSVASPTWRTRLALVGCLHLAFSWVVYLAWDTGDRVWAGWIAVALVLMAIWYVYRLRGKAGLASIRVTATHIAVLCGAVLVVLNLRLDVWLAARREVSIDEIHQLLPIWVLPLLTLALVIWVGILWAITKPKQETISHQ